MGACTPKSALHFGPGQPLPARLARNLLGCLLGARIDELPLIVPVVRSAAVCRLHPAAGMTEISGKGGRTVFSPRQLVVGILALAGAGLWATGCNSGCSALTSGGQTPCASDHEILVCVGGGDVTGPYETRDRCPVDRPVCQSGMCVSPTPVMCMEQLLGTGLGNSAVSAADLDGNGLDDVIFGGPGGDLWAVLAQADGSFSAARPVPSGLLVDVNGDGLPDVIDRTAKPATVALGDGHLGFGPARTLPTSFNYLAGGGDFDGDGLQDLVDLVTNDDRSTDVAVHLAAANFAAGEHLHLSAEPFVSGAEVFPLQSNGQRWLLEIDHPASFETPVTQAMAELRVIGDLASPALATIPVAGLPADYDGDGNTDLVIRESVALGDGKGGFRQGTAADTGPFPAGPADFDGDGHLDFKQIDATGHESKITTLRGNGHGQFSAGKPSYVQRYVQASVPIRIAGRQVTDLAVIALDENNNAEIRILRGDCP